MKKISAQIRQKVVIQRKRGLTHRQISKNLSISLGSVFSISKDITLSPSIHKKIKQNVYLSSLAKLSKTDRLTASSKGGKQAALVLKPKYSRETLIQNLIHFYQKTHRLPTKRDFVTTYRSYIRVFGTWNQAISSAGLEPNPALFAKSYKANDGHWCDSLSEKMIDDWLTARKIPHLKNVPYPGSRFRADFKINDTYIEFFGLTGQLSSYDQLAKRKIQFIEKQNLKMISLYPNDLFPKFLLSKKLSQFENINQQYLP